jgi:hypothetical protein
MPKWIQHRLRRWNVVTMLAGAGLLLSAAAILVVIGIGNVQIAVARGRVPAPDLYSDWWFRGGLLVGFLGLVWGSLAVAAIGSQSNAHRDFPDLEIEILETGNIPTQARTRPARLCKYVVVRVSNREVRRVASLDVRLEGPIVPSKRAAGNVLSVSPLVQSLSPSEIDPPLRCPLHLEPQSTQQGWLAYDPQRYGPSFARRDISLRVRDYNCGKSVVLPFKDGEIYGT